ncbi:MAG: TonB family protein [Candidatus Aceula meridiana]|nr:TonB family protein [Candidatus Aceula meridiana]
MTHKQFNSRQKTIALFQIVFLFMFVSLVFSASPSERYLTSESGEIRMIVGDVQTVWTKELTRVSITNPEVADVLEVASSEISLLGKRPGKTELFVWDKTGKRSVRIWVFKETLELVEMRIQELLRTIKIENLMLARNEMEGKIVISGELEEKKLKEYNQIIEPFSESIINLVQEQEEIELVEIDVQVVEMSSSYFQNLGISWANSDGDNNLNWNETLPDLQPGLKDFFKIGGFTRTSSIQASVNALVTQGKAKVLSRPKLVVKSGEDASFHVGGEIPIRTTTISSEGTVENITFKTYGVDLNIKATVKNDKSIDIDLNVDISDIDASNKAGDVVAYTNRTAATKLFLDNKQTVVLAGFIKENRAETISRIPFLSDIPILGALFRNKTTDPDNSTELFITLTPTIIARRGEEESQKDEKGVVKEQTVEEIVAGLNLDADKKEDKKEAQASKPPEPIYQSASVPGNLASYVRRIQEKIAKKLIYPQAAKDDNQQGQVVLDVSVHKDGGLLLASVRESSGHTLLDEAALQTARQNSPYGHFPELISAEKLTITIPIVYRLE